MILSTLFEDRYLPHARRTLNPRTVAEYGRLWRKLIMRLGDAREISKITLDDVERWFSNLPGKVQANRALAVLSAGFTYAIERKLLAVNPCRGMHRNRERGCEFFYTPAQTKAILATALSWPDIRGPYIALELLTGCRPSELLGMTPHWRTAGAVRTPSGKTGGRTIFLSGAAEAILDGLQPVHGGRYFPEGMDLRRAWYAIMRKAAVPRARRYDLRHTFASAALAAGITLDVVGLMLGHKKRETTLIYAHLAPDVGVHAAAAAAARMGA